MRLVLLWAMAAVVGMGAEPKAVMETKGSMKAVLHGVPVGAVEFGEGFWSGRRKAVVEASLPSLLALFEEKGILDNFRRISGRKEVGRRGPLFTDSDVYKWLEAVGFVLQERTHGELRAAGEKVIDEIAAAQEESGYVNTFYSRENRGQRHMNMRHGHELYCLGHLIQAGIAWQRATGDGKLLGVGRRMADYVWREFGPGRKPIFEGHPEIELALIELARETGERKYVEMAGYFLKGDARNLAGVPGRDLVYLFTVKPFVERTRMEGHAVRAAYACAGAADYYLETGDEAFAATLGRLWADMTEKKQYVTGGIGSRAAGEAFGEPYELPNQQAYTESCASIATMFWNWRMMQAWPEGKYMDNFERALYNGANSGLSLDGRLYCYRNPLELVGNAEDRIRNPWYDTTCCPPNLQRILASLPGYQYSTSRDGLWVHLYHPGRLRWRLEDGMGIEVEQKTEYPWKGKVELVVKPAVAKEFALRVRIPAWSEQTVATVNGKVVAAKAGSYLEVKREWKSGDVVVLHFDVRPRMTVAHARVRENLGKVAVERGPLVYCMEGLDQAGAGTVYEWYLNAGMPGWKEQWRGDLLGGVVMVEGRAVRGGLEDGLYRRLGARKARAAGVVKLIPYYTFSNREVTTMQVWIPVN